MKMNFHGAVLIVILSILMVRSTDPAEKMLLMMKIVTDCKVSSGASSDDISKLMIHSRPSSKEGKCMFACVMESLGIVKAGQVYRDGLLEWGKNFNAPGPILAQIADACEAETDPDPCESAVKIGLCYKKAGAKYALDMDL